MREEEVFDAIAALVEAGEYLDQIAGRPGIDLDGPGMFVKTSGGALARIYQRRSPEFLDARARGWIDPLPRLRPASLAAVEEVEAIAGHPLPEFLRRLYLQIGNGGFGPGYGLAGLRDGHAVGGWTALTSLVQGRRVVDSGPTAPFLLCDWGCAITNVVDLKDGQIWGNDPNPSPSNVSHSFPQYLTVAQWFAKWLEGRLYQPWLRQDPTTGDWRGATDAEHEAEQAELMADGA